MTITIEVPIEQIRKRLDFETTDEAIALEYERQVTGLISQDEDIIDFTVEALEEE